MLHQTRLIELIKSVFSIVLERGDCILTSDPGWSYYSSLAREKFCDTHYFNILKDDYTYYFDVEDILKKAEKYHPFHSDANVQRADLSPPNYSAEFRHIL